MSMHNRISKSAPGRLSDDRLAQQVCSLITRTLSVPADVKAFGLETRLYGAGLGVDSLDTLRLVVALEEEFGIFIEDTDLTPAAFQDVRSVVELVRLRRRVDRS